MAKGDTQLIMSLLLVMVGSGLFLAGFGSSPWVEDDREGDNGYRYSLWEICFHRNGSDICSGIEPGQAKAYYEATRVLTFMAMLVYIVVLCSCFTADDRHPSESWLVCLRRYIHAVVTFVAGGLAFLSIIIFGSCYDDDDWFTDPSLGLSYWMAFAGCICTVAGGVMRVVFIVWPDRPTLPTPNYAKKAPQAPRKRNVKARKDHELGSDPLPQPVAPGRDGKVTAEQAAQPPPPTKKKTSKFKRFLSLFSRKTTAVADISQVVEDVKAQKGGDDVTDGQGSGNRPSTSALQQQENPAARRGGRSLLTATTVVEVDEGSDYNDGGSQTRGRRRGRRRQPRGKKKRVSMNDPPFNSGYNIPLSPPPDRDVERESAEVSYEMALANEDLRSRAAKTPPAPVFPPELVDDEPICSLPVD